MFDKIKELFNKKKTKQDKDELINLYILVTTRSISGGLSISYPNIDDMKPMIDLLSKVPNRTTNYGNYIYKPIGIIYEAEAKQL